MTPTPSQVHVNVPLTNLTIAYMQSAEGFVADKVFPVVPVAKQSDLYYEFNRGDFNRNQMKTRAPGAETVGGSFRMSTTPYYAKVFGLHKDIPDQLRANADSVLSLDNAATDFLGLQAMLSREIDWAAAYFTTGVWGKDITGVSGSPSTDQVKQWNDPTSTPIEDIRSMKTYVLEQTGVEPNGLVLGQRVWDKLVDHPDILDRIKGAATPGNPAIATRQAVASFFELQNIFVMKGIQNTADEGLTATHSFIGGKRALLVYSAPKPGLMTVSGGYTFAWKGYLGGSSSVQIKRFRMEHLASDRVEIEETRDQKLTSSALGVMFDAVIA